MIRAPSHQLIGDSGRRFASAVICTALLGLASSACTPTVRVEAPKDPITINLNVKADVVVTLKETAREDIQANPDVF